jgi:transaldolase
MRKAAVTDYEGFAREVLELIPLRPVSFEVFSDDFEGMHRQAMKVAGWGPNVYVKIPITTTQGVSTAPLLRRLVADGVKVNVTALTCLHQVATATAALEGAESAFISVFAGRVADTGRDPLPLMIEALQVMSVNPGLELIWASPREVFNVVQASQIGCHVITVTSDILAKLNWLGRDLDRVSLDTVSMFHNDAVSAGFEI